MGNCMDKCKTHPIRFAIGRCKRCHVPMCSECKISTDDGIFCSEECIEQFRTFQSRMANYGPSGSRFSLFAWIKYLVITVVLIVVIVGALSFWLGTTDPGEMLEKLRQQLKLIM